MAKKKTRKELFNKPDEFITFSAKLFNLLAEYQTQVLYAVGAVVLIAITFSGYGYLHRKSESKAFSMLQNNLRQYIVSLKKQGPQKALDEVNAGFSDIIDKYSGNMGGKLARLEFANICYKAGDIDKAIDSYDKALTDFSNNQFVKCQILNSLGYSYEEKKDLKSAVNYFEKVIAQQGNLLKDEAYFNLGRLFAILGEENKSKEAYEKICSDFADSSYFMIAKEHIS